jgi:anti-sigma factor ChrR (cupin superfamily)
VLDGVFQDEHGDYPAGYYVRNPPTSSHTPGSAPGCTLFVKLWQFDPEDRTEVRLDTSKMAFEPNASRSGVALMPLFHDHREKVRLERWAPRACIELAVPGGMELLVLEGEFSEGGERLGPQSWLRLPCGARLRATAGAGGCQAWVKTGHLAQVRTAPDGT